MTKISKLLIILILLTISISATSIDSNTSDNNTSNNDVINTQLKKTFKTSPSILLKNIAQKKLLKKLYRNNNYKTLWFQNNKLNQEKFTKLFEYIKNDITLDQKGLIYKNYHNLEKELDDNLTEIHSLRLELKLTSLYHNFLEHLIYGEIQWKHFSRKLTSLKKRRINAAWIKVKPKFNITNLIYQNDIDTTILEVTPKNFGYGQLLLALEKLQKLKENGGWEKLPSFKKLALGDSGDIVLKLRNRLKISGDYQECNETNESVLITQDDNISRDINLSRDAVFGHCLDNAVKIFQKRHGLVIDGIVGGGTQRALNTSIDEKIHKIRLNIDRIKWLPREDYERYLVVNIPQFMLHYIENDEVKKELRVIVGDKKHPTPIFSEKISYIVLNPYWKVPEGIVKREIIPAMVKNPNYLRQQGLEAHRTWDENSRLIDTSWLYWEDYLYGQKFPYRLMQPPGPKNALGKIKFKFPNKFSVYLHDTPTKHLFKRRVRAFSHGCVRLSQPRSLLETIATFNPKINIKKAKKVLKGKRKKFLSVDNKLRIYLVYLTAGMNDKGQIEFRNDIYNYDKYQKRRLR
ncbi:MAG: L,D-transpeptidase YcbB [uncultured Sulfurovum sp.]|uniref:L,D-transpeptidase YcbB n=1 Tax=uncultured Sulfurovum sp. TaxID=269237 RepID=A0A6S6TN81_9BACT|nr:MAG: L,D-transpeptidase YcbB [uncultured Sulfurovum sp.]